MKPPLSQRSNQSSRSNRTDGSRNSAISQNSYAKKVIAYRRVKQIQSQFMQAYQIQHQNSQNDPQLPEFINKEDKDEFSFGGYHQTTNTLSYRGSLLDPNPQVQSYQENQNGRQRSSDQAQQQRKDKLIVQVKKKSVLQRKKMHTPIDEMMEEDESSQSINLSGEQKEEKSSKELSNRQSLSTKVCNAVQWDPKNLL
eukprot:403356788